MKKNGATAKEISPKGVANLKSKDCNLIDAMLYTHLCTATCIAMM